MPIKQWFLLAISAAIYACSFIMSAHLWWLIFFAFLILFYVAYTTKLSFLHGYVWGLIALTIHSLGVFYSLFYAAQGPYLYRLMPSLIVVTYFSIYSGLWFLIADFFITHFKLPRQSLPSSSLWISATLLYVHWIDNYVFWLFDYCEGYCFFHPLLPLTQHPQLLILLPIVGKTMLTFLLLLPAAVGAFLLISKKHILSFLVLISLSPWIYAWFSPLSPNTTNPPWLKKIGCICKEFKESIYLSKLACELRNDIQTLLKQSPQIELILLPEASFSSMHATLPELTQQWSEKKIGKPVHIMIGLHRLDGDLIRNSLCWIYNGKKQCTYDKRHTMFLTERQPQLFMFDFLKQAYLSKRKITTPSNNQHPNLPLLQDTSFVPYICSELFFKTTPDDTYSNTPILLITGDAWVKAKSIKCLYVLLARLRAIEWQRDILFVSYSTAVFISRNGNTRLLDACLKQRPIEVL